VGEVGRQQLLLQQCAEQGADVRRRAHDEQAEAAGVRLARQRDRSVEGEPGRRERRGDVQAHEGAAARRIEQLVVGGEETRSHSVIP
jgi:hypothetical protein